MTRTGKIARLPRRIREQLNTRLQDNEPGIQILAWLNALPPVVKILNAYFRGRPVNAPNLTEWKRGGYRDWLMQQDALNLAREFAADADELQEVAESPLTDKITPLVVARYMAVLKTLSIVNPTDEDGRKQLHALTNDLVALRRGDHSAAHLQLKREWLAIAQSEHKKNEPPPRLTPEEKEARYREIFGISEEYGRFQQSAAPPPHPVPDDNPDSDLETAPEPVADLNQIKPI